MSTKTYVWIGMIVGSLIGGFIPSIWGASLFSYSSLLFNGVGGILGVIAGVKLGKVFNS